MKIIFWNIKFIAASKLTNDMNATSREGGLGNTGEDYIVKVVTGDDVWKNATSKAAADVFVILELKSGGTAKGADGSGASLKVLPKLVAALKAPDPARKYAYVKPLVVGHNEVVGVIYDKETLTYVSSDAMRNTNGDYLSDRTPFRVEFTVKATGEKLNVVGIHGPKSKPPNDYRKAIEFSNALGAVAAINQAGVDPKDDLCVGGDFNCCPDDYYVHSPGTVNEKNVYGLSTLRTDYGYQTTLPTPTKTSLRRKMVGSDYLSQPYDNILFVMPSEVNPPEVKVIDLVGKAPTWEKAPGGTFNAAIQLSDHLPMCIEY